MKILFICKHIPYSETKGVDVKIANLLRCMRSIAKVTCVFIQQDQRRDLQADSLPDDDRVVANRSLQSPVIRYLNNLKDNILINKNLKRQLEAIIAETAPDLIWLEFGYICQLLPALKKYGVPLYYGSHNSQWKLDYEVWRSNRNLLDKLKMAPFIALYWLQERLFMNLADRFFCIATHDIDYYSRFVARNKLSLLPYFFDARHISEIEPYSGDHPYICLVGSLRSYQNFSGALFFLEQAWPRIECALKELRLYVIGELPEENSPQYRLVMEKKQNCSRATFTGIVESVIPYVKGALVNVVPITIGSGVRTKIIESAACQTPVVSTSVGAEGLPFENGDSILIADEAGEFAENVIRLVENGELRRDLSARAFDIYRETLSFEAGQAALATIFAESTEAKDAPAMPRIPEFAKPALKSGRKA